MFVLSNIMHLRIKQNKTLFYDQEQRYYTIEESMD